MTDVGFPQRGFIFLLACLSSALKTNSILKTGKNHGKKFLQRDIIAVLAFTIIKWKKTVKRIVITLKVPTPSWTWSVAFFSVNNPRISSHKWFLLPIIKRVDQPLLSSRYRTMIIRLYQSGRYHIFLFFSSSVTDFVGVVLLKNSRAVERLDTGQAVIYWLRHCVTR